MATVASRRVSFLEIELTGVDKFSRIVYSPPFAKETLNDRYWHLAIRPEESNCYIYIEPLKDVKNPTSIVSFKKLSNFFRITVKDPEGKDIEPKRELNPVFRMFRRSSLCGTVIVGVEMISTKFDPRFDQVSNPMNMMKYIEPLSKGYKITKELPEQIDVILGPALDVKFNVQHHPLFVNSEILSKFSPYWKEIFGKQYERDQCTKEPFRHTYREIDIEEYEYHTILCMIQVAYTGDIAQLEMKRHTWELLILADRYQIPVLGTPVSRILDSVNIDNAAELYFGYSWRLPVMKNKLKSYIVDNFVQIIKTEAYNDILKNHEKYPMFLDMYGEILITLYE